MSNRKDEFKGNYLRYAGVGFEFAGAVGLFCLLGHLADRRWQTEPTGLVIGCLVGIAVGTYVLIKAAIMINRDQDRKE